MATIMAADAADGIPDARNYRGFADLAAAQVRGRDYEISIRRRRASRVAVVAPHAGGIEDGTSELARAIAADDFNLYLFEGTRSAHNYLALHLTSHLFDEPQCLRLIAACTAVVSVHGCAGADSSLYLGGRDTALRDRLADGLRAAGLRAAVDGHRFPAIHPRNICNRGATGRGVQLEATHSLRQPAAGRGVAAAIRAVFAAAAGGRGAAAPACYYTIDQLLSQRIG
ncbi:MAG TPA: poly-gamma-glutamate hydrolase family protein [Steroidobacteraceae bacterium]|nr:poly-gamma-glutamate hydrolase family protein [Steroidobacteraceae bacterium]